MTKREKILAALVGGMVLTVGLVYVVDRARNLFERRYDRLVQLEQDIAKQQRSVQQGTLAAQRMADYVKRSLPGDRTLARSLYQEWLLDRAVKTGFNGVNVSPLPGRANGEIYYQHAFLVTGQADLRELTQFLYELESAGFLQRISRLTAKPIAKSKDLDVSLTVEALSLNGAPDSKKLDGRPAKRPAQGELAAYVNTVVSRNFFAPANKPPELSSTDTQTGYPGRPLRFQVRGRDPDKEDKLTYSFDGRALDGARIDPASGQFEWTPPALGKYEVAVRVTDNGLPAKSSTATIKISVVEPPPVEEPKPQLTFDTAKHSFLTGITEVGGKRQVWVTVRTEGRILKLQEGDQLSVGSLKGVVNRIEPSQAEIKTDDGKTLVVALGKSLLPDDAAKPSGT